MNVAFEILLSHNNTVGWCRMCASALRSAHYYLEQLQKGAQVLDFAWENRGQFEYEEQSGAAQVAVCTRVLC